MYKKVLGLALGALLTAGLATGCGSSSDNLGGGGGGGGGSKGSIKIGGLFTLTPQAFGNEPSRWPGRSSTSRTPPAASTAARSST